MRAMRRRITAWISLLAMLLGVALPAHAYAHLRAPGGIGSDLCASGTGTRSTPTLPEHLRDIACDACAGCAGPAVTGAMRAPRVVAAGYVPQRALAPAPAPTPRAAFFHARAPPALP
jgi:hypothetical protein